MRRREPRGGRRARARRRRRDGPGGPWRRATALVADGAARTTGPSTLLGRRRRRLSERLLGRSLAGGAWRGALRGGRASDASAAWGPPQPLVVRRVPGLCTRGAGLDPRRRHQEFENSVSVRESRWCAPCIIRAYAQKISEVKSYRVCCAASVSLKSEAWVESAWRHATGCTCTRAKQRVTVRSGRDVLLCCGGTARAIGPGRRRVRQGEIAPMQSATRPHAPLRCASRHSGPCGFARRLARAVFARAWSSPTAWEGTHGLARRSEGRHHRRCCDLRRASDVQTARAHRCHALLVGRRWSSHQPGACTAMLSFGCSAMMARLTMIGAVTD